MGQKMHLEMKIGQQLRMTQQLQQAIKLLQLSRQELVAEIHEELIDNPALEEIPEADTEFAQMEDGEPPADPDDKPEDLQASLRNLDSNIAKTDSIDWDTYLNLYQTHTPMQDAGYKGFGDEDMPNYEATLTAPPTLVEHLARQVKLTRFDELQEQIAMEIIGNINEDGYLVGITLEEIAEKYHVELDSVVYVQETIQEFDPTGVGSRDLRECLLSQAEILYPDNRLVHQIIDKHLHLLERKNYKQIAKEQKTNVDRVAAAAKVIASLNPRPGVKYSDERPMYITPDVYVERTADGEYHVMINDDGLPKLRVNSYYRELIGKNAPQDAANYIKEKMGNARWFLRSLQQRERTPARLLRKRHQLPQAHDPQRYRRRHKPERIDDQPRHYKQIHAYAAGHL